MTNPKRKWTYWHKVITVDEKDPGTFEVGQIFGSSSRHEREWHGYTKERGFNLMATIAYLGKLPYDLHEKDPAEATRRIEAGQYE